MYNVQCTMKELRWHYKGFANIKIKSSKFTNCKKKVDLEDFLYLCESNIIKSHSDFLNCTLYIVNCTLYIPNVYLLYKSTTMSTQVSMPRADVLNETS